jgi:hypothetical protein
MIQNVVINGRAGSACLVDGNFTPVDDEADAAFLKVVFDDGADQLILAVAPLKPEPAPKKAAALAWAEVLAESEQLLREFDPSEPRDESGKWTEGGGGGSGSTPSAPKPTEPVLDPNVIAVGGDEWNKATAQRLEREYQTAKPALDKMAADSVGHSIGERTPETDDWDDQAPEEWDQLSGDIQDQAAAAYYEQNLQSYLDNEQQNYYDSGTALDDAKAQLEYQFVKDKTIGGGKIDWAEEAIANYRENYDGRIPYTDQQLIDAISIDYQTGYEGNGKFTVTFDDSKLQEPSNLPPPEQGTLPGIEPAKREEQLTKEMRDGLSAAIEAAFNKKADDTSPDMQPPDYLEDSAKEMVDDDWANKSDYDKFEWTKSSTELIEGETPVEQGKVVALPKTYDPLNKTSGADYKNTQALARQMSVNRAADLIAKNVLKREITPELLRKISAMDHNLWAAWKTSSTSQGGKLLQIAIADELGGRLNAKTSTDLDRDEVIARANDVYKNVGGYEGVKEYVRAKWETTQYLLDKAGIKTLDLYRGIKIDPEKFSAAMTHMKAARLRTIGSYQHLPTLDVVRNGAASTSVSPGIANGWGAPTNRVVLRAQVPRTAAVSVPAYGINVHSEQEVVVAGTAWKGWDAWAQEAPKFDEVPLAA